MSIRQKKVSTFSSPEMREFQKVGTGVLSVPHAEIQRREAEYQKQRKIKKNGASHDSVVSA